MMMTATRRTKPYFAHVRDSVSSIFTGNSGFSVVCALL